MSSLPLIPERIAITGAQGVRRIHMIIHEE